MINPSRYRIIAIGKVRKPWIQSGIDLYMKRLPGLLITEIRDSSIRKEAETIRSALKDGELLIPLCEEGEKFTSLTFSKCLQTIASQRTASLSEVLTEYVPLSKLVLIFALAFQL